MNDQPLSDAVINALSVLKRVHRLSGTIAILRGELIHADVSLRAFSSAKFTRAVQSVFDEFARRSRRIDRITFVYGEHTLLLISGGPMIIGFIVERVEDLETVETGVSRFVVQFGSALSMDQPPMELERITIQAEPKTSENVATDGDDEAEPELTIEPDTEAASDEITEDDASGEIHAKALRKLLPEGIASGQDIEETIARIPNRRIRRMLQSELDR